ncbi:MAG TPA: hypothetical protein VNZ52_05440 [Candidatus Thermoplasmatota archaeon]|nr:hypothetical protein [Candidatus Thermoplasmatota archaeon]
MYRTQIAVGLACLTLVCAGAALAGLGDVVPTVTSPPVTTPGGSVPTGEKPVTVPETSPLEGDQPAGIHNCQGSPAAFDRVRCGYVAARETTSPAYAAAAAAWNDDELVVPEEVAPEGAVVVSVSGDASGSLVGVSVYGDATGVVALSPCGGPDAGEIAVPGGPTLRSGHCRLLDDNQVSLAEDASGINAVSVLGDAEGDLVSVSGTGDAGACRLVLYEQDGRTTGATPFCALVAVAPFGNATADAVAVSGTGDAGQCNPTYRVDENGELQPDGGERCTAVGVSATGGATGMLLSVSGRDGVSQGLV